MPVLKTLLTKKAPKVEIVEKKGFFGMKKIKEKTKI